MIREPSAIPEAQRIWFQPGLDRLAALAQDPDPGIRSFFSSDQPVFLARAPGRLDVMGGIADYSGAQVLELPLERSTSVLVQRQAAPYLELASRREGRWDTARIELSLLSGALADPAALRAWSGSSPTGRWAAYPLGVIQYGLRLPGLSTEDTHLGFRLLIDSSVPEGKGVASSAALEVASMFAVLASCHTEMAPARIASACQWVENHVVGAPCGIMDQMTSACGVQDRLLLLRCQPDLVEGFVPVPPGYRFFGIDSGVRHDVSAADYGTVRTAAFMGYRMIAAMAGLRVSGDRGTIQVEDPAWHGYLANISPEDFRNHFERSLPEQVSGADFLEQFGGITDPVTRVWPERHYPVRQATAHPIGEQARVARFVDLLRRLPDSPALAGEVGELMYASHRGYGACGLGSPGTDRLVELIAEAGPRRGMYGAKITGGGSGGTVAVFGRAGGTGVIDDIARRYTRETGRETEVFECSGPGAGETGVVRAG